LQSPERIFYFLFSIFYFLFVICHFIRFDIWDLPILFNDKLKIENRK